MSQSPFGPSAQPDGQGSFPPVTKSEYAYVTLRRRILDGELPPGRRLLLRPLADELRLSVMPVRDAIKKLESDGLVRTESHRGATVTPIPRETIVDTISIRMWLEVLAVREATPRHTPETLDRAAARLDEAEGAAATGDGLAYSRANRRLHEALEEPAPEALKKLIDEVWERLWHARRTMSLFALVPHMIDEAQHEHREILARVREGEAVAAGEAMAHHRDSSLVAWEAVLSSLDAA